MSSIPETMMAVQLVGHGGPEVLVLRDDVPVPVPGAGEVLIRVGACGMNNTDVNTRVGWYSKAVTGEATGEALDVSDGDASWGAAASAFLASRVPTSAAGWWPSATVSRRTSSAGGC
ncbi:MAG: hypothetical protein MK189_02290 [Acidimicrobiales bacterium]|nr:hypothetical protein [Acidimicrobiales bacterium]